MATVLDIIRAHENKIEGIKISLLNAEYERELRAQLPEGVLMFTGDDYNYADLIAGDSTGKSHALLGVFDPIAPIASRALSALAQGNLETYHELMTPTVALSRELVVSPTQYYKAGVVFLAWLKGHQDPLRDGGRDAVGAVGCALCRGFSQSRCGGVLIRPELALRRMGSFLSVNAGIGR